jgi:DNA-binding GntR family transcriptional regulator
VASLVTVSVVDALAEELRERVLDGVLPAGGAVAETDVATEFGVSRPTAKSALTALVGAGLLRRDANRPAYVPRLTAEDARDLFRVRVPLELEVVRTLVEGRDVPPAAEAAVEEMRRLSDDVPTSAFVATDLRFHHALVDRVASPRLSRLYGTIAGELHLTMIQTRKALGRMRIVTEHAEVLARLRAGDGLGAERAMREHLHGAGAALAATLPEA